MLHNRKYKISPYAHCDEHSLPGQGFHVLNLRFANYGMIGASDPSHFTHMMYPCVYSRADIILKREFNGHLFSFYYGMHCAHVHTPSRYLSNPGVVM